MKKMVSTFVAKMLKTLSVFFISALLAFGGGAVWAAPKGSPWGGDYFPNVKLTDQDGTVVRFYDDLIKDKVFIINFIYTHCGDTCPLETANLKRVYNLIQDRVGKDIFFYSISVDPKHDTPKVLKEYAERYKVGAGWRFLTGSKEDTTLIRKKLGLFREGVDASELGGHNTSFMLGNEGTGKWIKRSPYDEPKILASLLTYSLPTVNHARLSTQVNYTSAEKIPERGKGEDVFRFRCLSCHSLGKEDGLGPGLEGVTKLRDRKWLKCWIKAPDKLLAKKDPTAMALYKQYNKILMPNLRLNDKEVEAVLLYLEGKENISSSNTANQSHDE